METVAVEETLTATRRRGKTACSLHTALCRCALIVPSFDLSGGLAAADSITRSRHPAYYFAPLLMYDGVRLLAADSLTCGVLRGW